MEEQFGRVIQIDNLTPEETKVRHLRFLDFKKLEIIENVIACTIVSSTNYACTPPPLWQLHLSSLIQAFTASILQ